MFTTIKDRVYVLEQEVKRLLMTNSRTETMIDYLIGDTAICPICGHRMIFKEERVVDSWRCFNMTHYTLTCPNDNFRVRGNSFRECVERLNTAKDVKNKD